MKFVKLLLVAFVVVALVVASGCAAKKTVKKTPPPDDGTGMVEETDDTPVQPTGKKYVVREGDTLWGISSMGRIYEDPFQWPLVYKANRDQIEDPDLIYPDQELDIREDYSSSEINDAVQKAKDTPPYKPHTTPRKKLPLRY